MAVTATKCSLVFALLGIGCMGAGAHHGPSMTAPAHAEPKHGDAGATPAWSKAVLDDLVVLGTGYAPTEKTRARAALVIAGRLPVADYVDGLLQERSFAKTVVPRMSVLLPLSRTRDDLTLEAKSVEGRTVYHLRKPCTLKEAEKVHPWWDMKSEVLVCPEAHQPSHLKDKNGWYCGGRNLDHKLNPQGAQFCGCGANLINCARDGKQYEALRKGWTNELEDTIAYVVERDLPFEQVFTMNESVRNGYGDVQYQRWRIRSGEQATFEPEMDFDAPPQLRPRKETVPGAHAGILTGALAMMNDAPRERQRDYFRMMWCQKPDSVNVTSEQIFGLGVTNLRDGEGWRKLASMPVCTNCHAKLDYGMQFFAGFPTTYVGKHFDGRLQLPGTGPLYNKDINDKIGEGPLSPRGFADIAVKQPAFLGCVAENVSKQVFAGQSSVEDDEAIQKTFAQTHSVRRTMRTAMLRYAEFAQRSSQPDRSSGREKDDAQPLRAQLETACGDCHSSGARGFLKSDELSRSLLIKMAEQVGWGAMPPNEKLSTEARRALIGSIAKAAFPESDSRAEALAHFNLERATMKMRPRGTVIALVHARVGGHREEIVWEDPGTGLYPSTVGSAAGLADFAVSSCRKAGKTGADLQRCANEALAPEGILGGFAGH